MATEVSIQGLYEHLFLGGVKCQLSSKDLDGADLGNQRIYFDDRDYLDLDRDGYLSLCRDNSDYKSDDPLLKDWFIEDGGASFDDIRSYFLELQK